MGLLDKLWKDPNAGKDTTPKKEEVKKDASKTVTTQKVVSKTIPTLETSSNESTSTITTPVNIGGGTEQPEFVEYFKEVFKEANLPGPDYYEFVSALDNPALKSIPDQMKFVSIFAGFVAQGCTKERLIDSAKTYIDLFTKKKEGFEQALEKSFSEVVGGREAEVERLNEENQKIDEEMQKLVEKKMKNGESISKLTTEITEETNRLKLKHANFLATYERMTKEISDNSVKIGQYIQQ